MLRASKPDHIFRALLTDAIDLMVDHLQLDDDPPSTTSACLLPKSATVFDLETVRSQLMTLGPPLTNPELVQPSDYHWLLLYEVLQDYCEGFTAMPGWVLTENYGIEHMEFGVIVDLFFWDTDFSMPTFR